MTGVSEMKMEHRHKQTLIKVVNLLVVAFATWVNPQAILAITALKFCFLLLEVLQQDKD